MIAPSRSMKETVETLLARAQSERLIERYRKLGPDQFLIVAHDYEYRMDRTRARRALQRLFEASGRQP